MKRTNYNEYAPSEVDSFYDEYPSSEDMKRFIRELFRRMENIENIKLDLSEWDSFMNYGQLKRNISYLNNQLETGMLLYSDKKLVLVDENDNVLSDQVIHTANGKSWLLENDETCLATPMQRFYWNKGLDVKVIVFDMELYFLPKVGENEILNYRERIIDRKFIDIKNPNNVFDKKNLEI